MKALFFFFFSLLAACALAQPSGANATLRYSTLDSLYDYVPYDLTKASPVAYCEQDGRLYKYTGTRWTLAEDCLLEATTDPDSADFAPINCEWINTTSRRVWKSVYQGGATRTGTREYYPDTVATVSSVERYQSFQLPVTGEVDSFRVYGICTRTDNPGNYIFRVTNSTGATQLAIDTVELSQSLEWQTINLDTTLTFTGATTYRITIIRLANVDATFRWSGFTTNHYTTGTFSNTLAMMDAKFDIAFDPTGSPEPNTWQLLGDASADSIPDVPDVSEFITAADVPLSVSKYISSTAPTVATASWLDKGSELLHGVNWYKQFNSTDSLKGLLAPDDSGLTVPATFDGSVWQSFTPYVLSGFSGLSMVWNATTAGTYQVRLVVAGGATIATSDTMTTLLGTVILVPTWGGGNSFVDYEFLAGTEYRIEMRVITAVASVRKSASSTFPQGRASNAAGQDLNFQFTQHQATWVTGLPIVTTYNTTVGSPFTYTIPTGAVRIEIECVGGGGGGGSGRVGATGTVACGGGPGSAGAYSFASYPASILASTLAVTVGAGGAGGAQQTTNSTNGNAGSGGNASQVTSSTRRLCRATGGNAGQGGTATTGTNGTGSSGGDFSSSGGSSANASGSAGSNSSASVNKTAGAGGPGGGITTANAQSAGGNGAAGYYGEYAGGTGGAAGGTAGSAGTAPVDSISGGGGAGGGSTNAGTGGNGGAGGAGAQGAGGGGGGAARDGDDSGAGGAGGSGAVRIIAYF